jgi:hypothetical protein
MVTVETLIAHQERDIARFRRYLASLANKPRPAPQYSGDLERRIAMAERSIAILRAAR